MKLTLQKLEEWLPLLPPRAEHFYKWLTDAERKGVSVSLQYETGATQSKYYITIYAKRSDKDYYYKVTYDITPHAYQQITGKKVINDVVIRVDNANNVVLAMAYALLTDFPNTAEEMEYQVYKWEGYMTPVSAEFIIKDEIIEVWIKRNDMRAYDYQKMWELPKTTMLVKTLADIVRHGRGQIIDGTIEEMLQA